MKKIDFEAHQTTKPYVQASMALGGGPAMPGGEDDGEKKPNPFGLSVADRVALMDRFEVQSQFISCAGGLERFPLETAIDVARKANDEYCQMSRDYPGRLLGYANLIPQDVDASLAELQRCHDELGFVAWNTHTNFTDHYIDEDQFFPLLEKADELGMFVYLHPGPPSIDRLQGLGAALDTGVGYHVDGAITLTRLICKGVFDRLPNLKIMLGHYGEAMPFMLDRIDHFLAIPGIDRGASVNEHTFDYYFKHNVYVTTSGNFSKAAFLCAKERLGIDHILFGTDFPIESYEESIAFLDSVGMTKKEQEMLYYINAREIFGIE